MKPKLHPYDEWVKAHQEPRDKLAAKIELDEQIVEKNLELYLKALGIERKIVRLRARMNGVQRTNWARRKGE